MIIIYYDKKLKSSYENRFNFIKLRKTFYGNEIYGIDTFDKFKYLLSLFKQTSQSYYIIVSGSGAKEFFASGYYEDNQSRIIAILIYCLNIEEYLPLKKTFTRISLIENIDFNNIVKDIKKAESFTFNEDEILKHYSSFLLLKEYYLKKPLETHKKICEYFDENYDTPSFDENIKKKVLNLLYLIAAKNEKYEYAKKILDNANDEKDLINCYTDESIIVYFLNKCLREVDDKMLEFAGLLNYSLLKYLHDNPQLEIKEDMVFYRKLNISIKDLYAYDLFEGKIICFPAFTSTSIDEDVIGFPKKKTFKSFHKKDYLGRECTKKIYNEKHVLFKIYYKFNEAYQCPCINIKDVSELEKEKEYLFSPFSFFKILKISMNEGTLENPVLIELEVIPKTKDFEKKLKNGGTVLYDKKEKCFTCIEKDSSKYEKNDLELKISTSVKDNL